MVAALYVQRNGVYYGLDDVDPWDKERDARLYAGPWPVVAHPPCSRWCQLAHVVQARYGHKVGDDGGCFAAALAAVRKWGGVLEHPAFSIAWSTFQLARPHRSGWTQEMGDDAWVCEVSQRAYGHPARKRTWLYYVGDAPPPPLDHSRPEPLAWTSYMRNHRTTDLPRLTKKQAAATPLPFRDLLLDMARSVVRQPLLNTPGAR